MSSLFRHHPCMSARFHNTERRKSVHFRQPELAEKAGVGIESEREKEKNQEAYKTIIRERMNRLR